ncbi:lipopolysaccharide heptosyltransferase I [Limnohabitans sp. JirII-29]|uniref:lipopolysaccharide heptosyltransferase I n=1 Tax=Limnohabitans sp. JirII-29 TaxID=1835756 RepID=UPI001E5C1D1D|nr:lipopolysaccharide heptosyltransferase I [Limnohabitans sp. JirII-29]
MILHVSPDPRPLKVLVVKLSSLGDVVHTLPAVMDMQAAFPNAQIDWVVERGFAPLVTRCQAVHRVIACELRRWRKDPWSPTTRAEWRAFKTDLQQDAYDAVIDLQGLTKSALVSWLARTTPGGKRYALANRTDGSGYERPTRWVADVALRVTPHIHAVARARVVCAQALGYAVPDRLNYGLGQANLQPKPYVVLVHGTSRADKEWPLAHWYELGQRLKQTGLDVALPHGNEAERIRSEALADMLPGAVVWPRLSLDDLTTEMAQCVGVVGVDSGLSHIAVALDVPHVQIYNFDTTWRTGPVGLARQCALVDCPTPTVDAVWQAWQRCVQATSGAASAEPQAAPAASHAQEAALGQGANA